MHSIRIIRRPERMIELKEPECIRVGLATHAAGHFADPTRPINASCVVADRVEFTSGHQDVYRSSNSSSPRWAWRSIASGSVSRV